MDVKGRAERIRAITTLFDNARTIADLATLSGHQLTAIQIRNIADNLAAGLHNILDQEFEHGADYGSRLAAEYMMKNYEIHDTWDRG